MKNQITIQIVQNSVIGYVSDAEFSTHELIEHLLKLTGPASVRISSFSITEIAIRRFMQLQENGIITSLQCLFDMSVKRHRLSLLFFASNVISEIGLTNIHAKLVFIENAEWKLVVVSSANLNINDKKETGIIITQPEHYSFYINHYERWFAESLKVTPDEFK